MPTITEINPQIGDVVEYRSGRSNYPYKYTMDHKGLKGKAAYLNENYFSGRNEGVDQFYVVSRASDKTKTLVVGQSYKGYNGHKWEAIFSDGEHVWMKGEGDTSAAYVWTIEGKAVSLGNDGTWDIDFGPILELETVQIRNADNMVIGEGEVTTKNGKPDWPTLKVKE